MLIDMRLPTPEVGEAAIERLSNLRPFDPDFRIEIGGGSDGNRTAPWPLQGKGPPRSLLSPFHFLVVQQVVGVGEDRRRAPGVDEDHRLAAPDPTLADVIAQPGHGLAGVDRIEDQAFRPSG